MQILEIIVGLVFVMLLFSLFATTVMEMIAGIFALRGENLRAALRHILAHDGDKSLFDAFENNILFRQLCAKRFWRPSRYRPPSYMSAESFWMVLSNTILDKADGDLKQVRTKLDALVAEGKIGGYLQKILLRLLDESEKEGAIQHQVKELKESVEYLQNENVKRKILSYAEETEQRVDNFRNKVENWYDTVMERSTGWYKRQTQYILFMIGLTIAIGFNADTIAIYQHLASDPQLAIQIADQAEQYLDDNANMPVTTPEDRMLIKNVQSRLADINELISDDVLALESPLGIGWQVVSLNKMTSYDWFIKTMGWLVTALSITLGAPFWFDLLRKLIHIRNSGTKP